MSASPHLTSCAPAIAILAIAACVLSPAAALAEEPGVLFRTDQGPAAAGSEVVSVLEPAGGQFVYSNQVPAAKPRARFAIGKAPRTEFTFFSPGEQQELRALQDRMSAEKQSSDQLHEAVIHAAPAAMASRSRARTVRATSRTHACAPSDLTDQLASLAWPKVVQNGTKVCVPKQDFADKPDWRDHVWCFDQGDGRVR